MMIKAVIFDIGGVLAFDVWENMLLDEKEGLAVTYHLDPQAIFKTGLSLWEQYAYRTTADWRAMESSYWADFLRLAGIQIPVAELIQLSERFIRPVEGMMDLVAALAAKNIPLAICSNNTEFWYARQAEKIGLYRYIPPSKIILSSRVGASKTHPGFELFTAAVQAVGVEKAQCLFIDDRRESITQAAQFGLPGILFPAQSPLGARYLKTLLGEMNVLDESDGNG